MERSPFRAVGETLLMTVLALGGLLGLRALGILAPVHIGALVGITVGALALSTMLLYWKRMRRLPLGLRVGLQVVGTTCVIYARSEGRRVGKECRSRWSPYQIGRAHV